MTKWGIVVTFGVAMTGAALLSGCTKDGVLEPAAPVAQAGGNTINMLKLPAMGSLQKWVAVSGEVTVADGGLLEFRYSDNADGKFKVSVQISFAKNSVSNDFTASMGMDCTYLMSNVDLEFGPHGTQFLSPATLSIKAEGLDLSMFTKDDIIHLYYDEAGVWTPMAGTVTIDPQKGTLVCKDGKLPHFSRYCFGQ